MSCHFVGVIEKHLVLLRFKDMRIKENPEEGRLHHQHSTESRWTGQGTLAKSFLISLSQAVGSASCLHVWVARCVWGGVRRRGEVEGGHRVHGVVQLAASWTGAEIWGWSRWTHSCFYLRDSCLFPPFFLRRFFMKQVNAIGAVTLVFSVVTNSSCGLLKTISTRRVYASAGSKQDKPHPHKLSSGRRDLLGT